MISLSLNLFLYKEGLEGPASKVVWGFQLNDKLVAVP